MNRDDSASPQAVAAVRAIKHQREWGSVRHRSLSRPTQRLPSLRRRYPLRGDALHAEAIMNARAEFHAERLQGLGGSDIAAALGYSAFKSPVELYLEKTGRRGR
jgi:hypothetical protein